MQVLQSALLVVNVVGTGPRPLQIVLVVGLLRIVSLLATPSTHYDLIARVHVLLLVTAVVHGGKRVDLI